MILIKDSAEKRNVLARITEILDTNGRPTQLLSSTRGRRVPGFFYKLDTEFLLELNEDIEEDAIYMIWARKNGEVADHIVQTNIPLEGSRKSAGAFAKSEENPEELYLLHDGSVGGGTRGIGKNSFIEYMNDYAKEYIMCYPDPSKPHHPYFIVSKITEDSFIEKAIGYVSHVNEYKRLVKGS